MEEQVVKLFSSTTSPRLPQFFLSGREYEQMKKEGLVPTARTYGAIIQGYIKLGQVVDALIVFSLMGFTSKSSTSKQMVYNILIDSLCKENKIDNVLSLMDEMAVKGVLPDVVTYNTMLQGLRDRNLFDKASELLDDMKRHACNPNEATLEIPKKWQSAVDDTTRLKTIIQGYEIAVSQP